MTIGDRVRLIRTSDSVHMTMEKFGEKIGVQKSAVSKIEKGLVSLTEQSKLSICREFHVNQVWLETGEGEMFSQSHSPELDALALRYGLDRDAVILMEKFAEMRPDQRKVIIDYVKSVAVSMGIKVDDETDERAALHEELDRQLDLEEEAEGRSGVS